MIHGGDLSKHRATSSTQKRKSASIQYINRKTPQHKDRGQLVLPQGGLDGRALEGYMVANHNQAILTAMITVLDDLLDVVLRQVHAGNLQFVGGSVSATLVQGSIGCLGIPMLKAIIKLHLQTTLETPILTWPIVKRLPDPDVTRSDVVYAHVHQLSTRMRDQRERPPAFIILKKTIWPRPFTRSIFTVEV